MAGITMGVGARDRRGYSSAGRPARPAPARTTRPVGPTPKARNGNEFVLALEEVSRGIRDPVAKLRYIRSSLARYQQADRCLRAVPFARLRHLLYRLLSLEGLRHLLSTNPMGAPLPVDTGTRRSIRRAGLGAVAALVVLGIGLVVAGFRVTREAAAVAVPAPPPPPLPSVAESLPPLPAGVAPASVWLVEETGASEHYSNGLRIDTTYSTPGESRRYRVFEARRGMSAETFDRPAGILFHTSESDIWPLDEAHNEKLRDSSHNLLRYLKRNLVYHYMVDRFGRVFRIVAEGAKANHAGNSVWNRGSEVFLNLNHAFLGICFETRWEGGRALPITAAQLGAGRGLTDYLRKRYDIPPDMCVGHGVVSVNARKHLIGHHLDWARGFPFEAFGLPDQYARPLPSVAIF
ncbi:MAG TPA: N-acetylmuramoyl-L-alanine amidase, partial [Vicinamibacteria bacterium]|nr:N-acetylmuramoyl-L-alanine amidase [Vicinamibacteria bacterium]